MPYDSHGTGYRLTDTSYAARPDPSRKATVQSQVLSLLSSGAAMTCDEVAQSLGLGILTVRPRLTELQRAGKVMDSGERRRLASGKRGIVWRAA